MIVNNPLNVRSLNYNESYWLANGKYQWLYEQLVRDGSENPTLERFSSLYYDNHNNGHAGGVGNTHIAMEVMDSQDIAGIIQKCDCEIAKDYYSALVSGYEATNDLEGDDYLRYEAQDLDEDDADEYASLMDAYEESMVWYISPVGAYTLDYALEKFSDSIILALGERQGLVETTRLVPLETMSSIPQ